MPQYQVRRPGTLDPFPMWIDQNSPEAAREEFNTLRGDGPTEVVEIKGLAHRNELMKAINEERKNAISGSI